MGWHQLLDTALFAVRLAQADLPRIYASSAQHEPPFIPLSISSRSLDTSPGAEACSAIGTVCWSPSALQYPRHWCVTGHCYRLCKLHCIETSITVCSKRSNNNLVVKNLCQPLQLAGPRLPRYYIAWWSLWEYFPLTIQFMPSVCEGLYVISIIDSRPSLRNVLTVDPLNPALQELQAKLQAVSH